MGLYHFRVRMYDPRPDRFCERDPILYVDGYSLFNPYFAIDRIDSLGTDVDDAENNPFGFPGFNFPKPPTLDEILKKIEEWKRRVGNLTVAVAKAECEKWVEFDKTLGDE